MARKKPQKKPRKRNAPLVFDGLFGKKRSTFSKPRVVGKMMEVAPGVFRDFSLALKHRDWKLRNEQRDRRKGTDGSNSPEVPADAGGRQSDSG